MTVNGKTYTNVLPFNGKFRLVAVYHPFKTVYAKRLNGKFIRLTLCAKRLNGFHIRLQKNGIRLTLKTQRLNGFNIRLTFY